MLMKFFARCYGLGATSEYRFEIGFFEGGGSDSAIFQVEGDIYHQQFYLSIN